MKKITKNNLILSIVLVAIIAFAGYFVLHDESNNNLTVKPAMIGDNITQAKTYTNTKYGFNIILSEEMSVNNVEDVIVIKNTDFEMQIYVSVFDENIVINKGRIERDIPDIKMQGEEMVNVAGVDAFTFVDLDQNTREIWFVLDGKLFQVTSRPEYDIITEEIMRSWKWS